MIKAFIFRFDRVLKGYIEGFRVHLGECRTPKRTCKPRIGCDMDPTGVLAISSPKEGNPPSSKETEKPHKNKKKKNTTHTHTLTQTKKTTVLESLKRKPDYRSLAAPCRTRIEPTYRIYRTYADPHATPSWTASVPAGVRTPAWPCQGNPGGWGSKTVLKGLHGCIIGVFVRFHTGFVLQGYPGSISFHGG